MAIRIKSITCDAEPEPLAEQLGRASDAVPA